MIMPKHVSGASGRAKDASGRPYPESSPQAAGRSSGSCTPSLAKSGRQTDPAPDTAGLAKEASDALNPENTPQPAMRVSGSHTSGPATGKSDRPTKDPDPEPNTAGLDEDACDRPDPESATQPAVRASGSCKTTKDSTSPVEGPKDEAPVTGQARRSRSPRRSRKPKSAPDTPAADSDDSPIPPGQRTPVNVKGESQQSLSLPENLTDSSIQPGQRSPAPLATAESQRSLSPQRNTSLEGLESQFPPAGQRPETQRSPGTGGLPTAWKSPTTHKDTKDYLKLLETKYQKFINGNELLAVPDVLEDMEPRTLSFVTFEAGSKKLVGITKENFEEALIAHKVPARYYYRRSFATWDVLLPSKEVAEKLCRTDLRTARLRLQPEYMGRRVLKIRINNVPPQIEEDHLGAFLAAYGTVESATTVRGKMGVPVGEHIFMVSLHRKDFDKIPDAIIYGDQKLTVMLEGRRPHCFNCRQQGHLARECPKNRPSAATVVQRNYKEAVVLKPADPTKQTEAEGTKGTCSPAATSQASGRSSDGEGWKQVTKKDRKHPAPAPTPATTPTPTPAITPPSPPKKREPSPPPEKTPEKTADPAEKPKEQRKSPSTKKHRKKPDSQKPEEEAMDDQQSQFKRRREDEVEDKSEGKNKKKNTAKTKSSLESFLVESQPSGSQTTTSLPPSPRKEKKPEEDKKSEPRHTRPQSASPAPEGRKKQPFQTGLSICRVDLGRDFPGSRLRPLKRLHTVDGKLVDDPRNFPDAPFVIAIIRYVQGRQYRVWEMIDAAREAVPGMKLVNWWHYSLNSLNKLCSGRVCVYVHPSLYRALKVTFPTDVGGIVTSGRLTTDLGHGSLGQTVGLLTPEHFGTVCNTD